MGSFLDWVKSFLRSIAPPSLANRAVCASSFSEFSPFQQSHEFCFLDCMKVKMCGQEQNNLTISNQYLMTEGRHETEALSSMLVVKYVPQACKLYKGKALGC